jgi:hypothetical protein
MVSSRYGTRLRGDRYWDWSLTPGTGMMYGPSEYLQTLDRPFGDIHGRQLPPPPGFPIEQPMERRIFKRANERVREDICDKLTDDDYIDASDIDVVVDEGVVYLRGYVPDRPTKRSAEAVAESVRGVREVINELRIKR